MQEARDLGLRTRRNTDQLAQVGTRFPRARLPRDRMIEVVDSYFKLYPDPERPDSDDAGPLALPVIEDPSDFPMDMLVGGALLNLRRWAADGVAPPRAPRMVILAEREQGRCGLRPEARPLQRDEHGNAVLGLRSPWVDVPIATYYPHSSPRSHEGAERAAPRAAGSGCRRPTWRT